jgi:soluble lytic murein transglycosylase
MGYYSDLAWEDLEAQPSEVPVRDPRTAKHSPLVTAPLDEASLAGGATARAAAYLRLGLTEAARREVLRQGGKDIGRAKLLGALGEYHEVIKFIGCAWPEWLGNDAEVCRLQYPLAYPEEVSRAAAEAGIHPHFVYAISHTESHFDPDAHSVAEARGAMQMIPPTARAVAQRARLPEPAPEALYDPATGYRLGARHLRELLDAFGGDVVASIAAYNAGAEAVREWRKRWPGVEPAEFVELIPYRETRQYVRKVLTALDAYGRLYGEGLLLRQSP